MQHIHTSTIKIIAAELMKCQLGEARFWTTNKYGGNFSASVALIQDGELEVLEMEHITLLLLKILGTLKNSPFGKLLAEQVILKKVRV